MTWETQVFVGKYGDMWETQQYMVQGRSDTINPLKNNFSILPNFRKSVAFLGSQVSPVCPAGNSNMYMKMTKKHLCNYADWVKIEVPAPALLYLPQISYGLTWDRNRDPTVRGRQLTASATERPLKTKREK
jgi:hypothetical protein